MRRPPVVSNYSITQQPPLKVLLFNNHSGLGGVLEPFIAHAWQLFRGRLLLRARRAIICSQIKRVMFTFFTFQFGGEVIHGAK